LYRCHHYKRAEAQGDKAKTVSKPKPKKAKEVLALPKKTATAKFKEEASARRSSISSPLVVHHDTYPEKRAWLKDQIKFKMKREPNVTLKAMKAWIKEDTSQDWNTIKRTTFHQFVQSNMEKFRAQGNLKRKPGEGQGPQHRLFRSGSIAPKPLRTLPLLPSCLRPGWTQHSKLTRWLTAG